MDLIETKGELSYTMRHPWELTRLKLVKKLISEKVKPPQNAVVLDIGCGDTFVVESIASDYPLAFFYAVDTAFTDEMIKDFRLRIKQNNIMLFKSLTELSTVVPFKPISLILLMDVMEHIEDDIGFLKNILQQDYIDENTYFLITVPSYQCLFSSHDRFLGHYRRYTNKMLKTRLEAAGLKVVSRGYFFFSLIFIRALEVLKEKIQRKYTVKNSTGLTHWNGTPFISYLLKNILWLDVNISLLFGKINLKMPGLSNYALCQKSA